MSAHVAILLCTYNAQPFLATQLDSLAGQTFKNWRVWASDDGSHDDTLAVLQQYQAKWGDDKLVIVNGPAAGPAANFMSLVHNENIRADYFAYCDQDDIWLSDKLERAVHALSALAPVSTHSPPLLYGTRTRYVDENNRELGLSPLFTRAPGFGNAIVQNIAGGNTMVYNQTARALLAHVPISQPIVMHDWWTYIAVTACGGQMIYDPYPSVRYRQHTGNVIGMNTGFKARFLRLQGLLGGRYRGWTDIHTASLQHLNCHMTPEARNQLACLLQMRESNVIARIAAFYRSGVYRQRILDNVSLYAMSIANRL